MAGGLLCPLCLRFCSAVMFCVSCARDAEAKRGLRRIWCYACFAREASVVCQHKEYLVFLVHACDFTMAWWWEGHLGERRMSEHPFGDSICCRVNVHGRVATYDDTW